MDARISLRVIRWATVLPLLLLQIGCGGGQPTGDELGLQVYRNYCASCHQADGAGIPQMYPPLQQTEWTEGDAGRLIRLVLHGMSGPIEVNGESYNGVMPPHRHLSDDQVAAVLSFIRTNFGNTAERVSAEDVQSVREATADRRRPWRADELEDQTGIPNSD